MRRSPDNLDRAAAGAKEISRLPFWHWWNVVRRAVAPGLVLAASFFGFLKFHDYAYFRPEVAICLGGIVAISLLSGIVASVHAVGRVVVLAATLMLFVDVQLPGDFWFHGIGKGTMLAGGFVLLAALLWVIREHAERVVLAAAATVLLSTLLLPRPSADPRTAAASSTRLDLPLIVHIVLDEHAGLAGLPSSKSGSDLRNDLEAFYQAQGFRIFDSAYSEHARTDRSLAHLFNFLPGQYDANLVRPQVPGFERGLARNAYVARLIAQGYAVRVHQSDFIQLCAEPGVVSCETYPSAGVGVLQELPLRTLEKARLIAGTFLTRSKLSSEAIDRYDDGRALMAKAGVQLPRSEWFYRVSSVNGIAAMRRFAHVLSGATRGQAYVAHVLFPHSPFLYSNACALRPFSQWGAPANPGDTPPAPTAASARYDAQVRCSMQLVGEMIQAIPPDVLTDAIIVVHGDHGSRLGRVDARMLMAEDLSPDNYRSIYSTLFAVRAPALGTGLDSRFVPVTCILRSLADGGFRDLPGLDDCVPDAGVFIANRTRAIVRQPLARFRRESAASGAERER